MVFGSKKRTFLKKLGIFGVITCLFTFGGVLAFLVNMGQDITFSLFLKTVEIENIYILIIQEILAVALATILNVLLWKTLFKKLNWCPKHFLFWEWSLIGVILPNYPRLLTWINTDPEIVSRFMSLSHHWVIGAFLVVFVALAMQWILTLSKKVESFFEKLEVLPEVDSVFVIIPSVLLGFYVHILVEYIFMII